MRLKVSDLIRLLAIAAFSFALSYGLPDLGGDSSVTSVFNMLFLFSFLAGFFINRALERRKTVTNAIEVELSRLRRIYNLSKRVSQPEWGKKMHVALSKYHREVAKDLFVYAEALADYRVIASMIYDYQPATRKDEMVFADLLRTTSDIALERRPLERALDTRIPGYGWAVTLLIVGGIMALLLLNRGDGTTPFSVGATLAGLIAVVDLLRSTDRFSKEETEKFQSLYRDNVPDA
jgi:hypothetical protein